MLAVSPCAGANRSHPPHPGYSPLTVCLIVPLPDWPAPNTVGKEIARSRMMTYEHGMNVRQGDPKSTECAVEAAMKRRCVFLVGTHWGRRGAPAGPCPIGSGQREVNSTNGGVNDETNLDG